MGMFRRSEAPVPRELDEEEKETDEASEEEEETTLEEEGDEAPAAEDDEVDDAEAEEEGEGADEAGDEAAEDEDADEGEEEEQAEDDDAKEPAAPARPILPRIAAIGHSVRIWRWWTPTLLVLIFALALFIRSYFYWQEACPEWVDTCLLSGNDPNYHKRAVDYLDANHRWLAWDPLQNYPGGGPNPNPPAYEFSILLIGYLVSPFFATTDAAVWWSMEMGAAIWAALTIFPVYFIGREMFGKRSGLIAAFLIGVMAGNIERTPVGFSDHDGFFVFFLVCGFYYFLRAMRYTKNRTYVRDWKSLESVTLGFRHFLREQRIAVLYTLLASTMWGAVALAWKGFPYIFAIVLVYYFFTVIALRWVRREDPFAVSVLTMMSFAWVMAMTLPYYYTMQFMHWYEIFYLVWAAAALVTVFFVPTRNVPWILLITLLLAIGGGTLLALSLFAPDVAETILSGAGYFARNKLYGTIAEAQPPDVSRLVASYGYATSLLAIGGVGLMVFRLPRRWSNQYVLMTIWAGVAVYMALSAVRFMYNATPVFAIIAGWMLWGIIDKTGFSLKMYRERWSKYLSWRKIRTVPLAHWFVSFFVVFMVIWPNTMQGLDAGIPFESKREWDRAIYNFMPDLRDPFTFKVGNTTVEFLNNIYVFRPSPQVFDPNGSNLWYLGAFGTSYMNNYWAVAMRWLATQDTQVPEAQRPAFISWWDYGHWAMHVGEHPAAADNFQNGYQFAGNFIGAQGEENASSLMLARYLQVMPQNAAIDSLAHRYLGEDGYAEYKRYAADPESFVDQIHGDPAKYGRRDVQVSAENAFLILVKGVINDKVSEEDAIWWLRDVERETAALGNTELGVQMRYFAVDVRMFPFSASNTGIFYAPIILADFDRNDFVEIRCQLTNGQTIPCDEVTNAREVQSTSIVYKPSFYNSMFTRAYLGYTSNDLGGGFAGFPGIQSSCPTANQQQTCLANVPPLQGWNMSHWRMVQRTVYANPYAKDIANHSADWRIITDQEADTHEGDENWTMDRQVLGLGERTGTGVMFLKYYHGAWINGTVRTAAGAPIPNARVTAYDDLKIGNPQIPGVPHGFAYSNANGSYSILVPFGNVTLVASTGGNPDPIGLRESVEVGRAIVPVSDDQAMRVEQDLDGNGKADYNIEKDIISLPATVKGRVYLDNDASGSYAKEFDAALGGARLGLNFTSAQNATLTAFAAVDGTFQVGGLAPGIYNVTASDGPHNWTISAALNVPANQTTTQDAPLRPSTVAGNVAGLNGPAVNLSVTLKDLATGAVQDNITTAAGAYSFKSLFPGRYLLRANATNNTAFEREFDLAARTDEVINFTSIPTVPVTASAYLDYNGNSAFDSGEAAANAMIELGSTDGDYFNLTKVGLDGNLSTRLPAGNYTARAQYVDAQGARFAGTASLQAGENGTPWIVRLTPAVHFNGTVFRDLDGNGTRDTSNTSQEVTYGSAEVLFESVPGRVLTRAITRGDGIYEMVLPAGRYTVRVTHSLPALTAAQVIFLDVNLTATTATVDLPVANGTRINGRVGFDADRNGVLDAGSGELLGGANLTFTKGPFRVQSESTIQGDYTLWLEAGNWSLTVTAPGYITNSTFAELNATDLQNNTKDAFVNASLVNVVGRLGFDADGDGLVEPSEGFAGVNFTFTAETAIPTFGFGVNTSVTTGADGNYSVMMAVGRYVANVTQDRGTGANAHRYESWNQSAGSAILHPFITPRAENLTFDVALRELTQLRGTAWFDLGSGIPDIDNRRAAEGAVVTLTGGVTSYSATAGANGVFEGYFPSGNYTAEGRLTRAGRLAEFLVPVGLTHPVSLLPADTELRPQVDLSVHAFDDRNGDGLENDGAEPLINIEVTFTNVTTSGTTIMNNNATVALLQGRTYHWVVNKVQDESLANATQRVQYKSEGNFTFSPGTTQAILALQRAYQVTGAFYWDRNADGHYTGNNREEPQGASLEFRNASDPSQVILSQPVEAAGSYTAYVPLGNYNITVAHPGFDNTNASWRVNVTLAAPVGGWKVDIVLHAHNVTLTGFTYLDTNRNGELNRYEAGTPVASLRLFNATNLSDARDLTVGIDGRFNQSLSPGAYNLYAVGTVNGTPVAGLGRADADPVGGLIWSNISLYPSFTVSGGGWYINTTAQNQTVPALDYTVASGDKFYRFSEPAGGYSVALPNGSFAVNATLGTTEFDTSMNYTVRTEFVIDIQDVVRDLNFTKVHRYIAEMNFTRPDNQSLAQGAQVNYTVIIRNNGTDNATFDLNAPPSSMPPGWTYQTEISNVTLDIGQSAQFWILINTSNQTRAGDNILQLRATPRNGSGDGGAADLKVTTAQVWGMEAALDVDAPAETAEQTDYFVSVKNTGNGEDPIEITTSGLPAGYSATTDKGTAGTDFKIVAFGTEKVTVHVKADPSSPAAPAGSTFQVIVRSLGSPAGNLTRVVEVPIRYADLSVGSAANATRATGPDGTDLTTKHPLVTPGFELAAAAAAVALAAMAARRRRRSL